MESKEVPETFKVLPKSRLLSAEELLSFRGHQGESSKAGGPKKTKPSGTDEEKKELERLYDGLKKQLSYPRIDRVGARTTAVWDSEREAVRIVKKVGKFQAYGYTEGKMQYLENHEALFLLEMNRLELTFNTVLVSVEQAYVLLLGEEKSKAYDNYLIYSTFSRAGYIVQTHKNVHFDAPIPEEDCIWEILLSSLDDTHRTPSYIKNSKEYRSIENAMNAISERISKPVDHENPPKKEFLSPTDYIDFDRKFPAKRKVSEIFGNEKPCKKARTRSTWVTSGNSTSFLDTLKSEHEYKEFQEIFENFDIIRLKGNQILDEESRDLEIDFDLYLPTNSFRKSDPGPPALRAFVLGSAEDFPTRSEIIKAYHRQEYKVPLIAISVSESKHIQAILYHFT